MSRGLDFDELYPGKFLKAADFKGVDVTYTIAAIHLEELESDKGKRIKGIVSFQGITKQLALNKTNGLCLKAMFGRDTANWVGKRVTFYPMPCNYEDADICIRVRGSPDIAQTFSFELKLPRKKARSVTMQKTGGGAARATRAPTIFERICEVMHGFGIIDPAQQKAELKRLTGKSNAKELVVDDIARVHEALAAELPRVADESSPEEADDIPL